MQGGGHQEGWAGGLQDAAHRRALKPSAAEPGRVAQAGWATLVRGGDLDEEEEGMGRRTFFSFFAGYPSWADLPLYLSP